MTFNIHRYNILTGFFKISGGDGEGLEGRGDLCLSAGESPRVSAATIWDVIA